MYFVEDNNFLNVSQKKFLERILIDDFLDFRLASSAVKPKDGGFHFIHHALISDDRPYQLKQNQKQSKYFESFKNILKSFCDKNYIQLNNVIRTAVNITFNTNIEKCPIHVDHDFSHKQVILYLNDAPGDTIICDNNHEPKIISKPEKFKAICFGSQPHYHYFPHHGIRGVVVYTFN